MYYVINQKQKMWQTMHGVANMPEKTQEQERGSPTNKGQGTACGRDIAKKTWIQVQTLDSQTKQGKK